jgi:hypothetical protein
MAIELSQFFDIINPFLTLSFGGFGLFVFFYIIFKKNDNKEEEIIDLDNEPSMCEKVIQLQKEIRDITQKYESKIINLRIEHYNEKEELIKTIETINKIDIRALKRQHQKDIEQLNIEKTELIDQINKQTKYIEQYTISTSSPETEHILDIIKEIPTLIKAFDNMTITQIKNVISKEDEQHILPGNNSKKKYIIAILYNHYRTKLDDYENPFHNAKFIKSVRDYLNDNKIVTDVQFIKLVHYFDYGKI